MEYIDTTPPYLDMGSGFIKRTYKDSNRILQYFYIPEEISEEGISLLVQMPEGPAREDLTFFLSPDAHQSDTSSISSGLENIEERMNFLITYSDSVSNFKLNPSYKIIDSDTDSIECKNFFFNSLSVDITLNSKCLLFERNYIPGKMLYDVGNSLDLRDEVINYNKSIEDVKNINNDDDLAVSRLGIKDEYVEYIKWQTNAFLNAYLKDDIVLWTGKFSPDYFLYDTEHGFSLCEWSQLCHCSFNELKINYNKRIKNNNLPLYSSTVLEILEKNG